MKKLLLLLLSVMAFSCGKENAVEKPARLLKEDEMENILYDLTMIQAIRSFQPQVLDNNKVDVQHYIYRKYKIDSLTFAQNNDWYANDPEVYKNMLDKVDARINKEKTAISKAVKKDSVKVNKSQLPPAKKDSLKKVVLNRLQDRQR